ERVRGSGGRSPPDKDEVPPVKEEANGARWPSRSSKPVAPRVERDGWVRLPGASAIHSPSPNRYAISFCHSPVTVRKSARRLHHPDGSNWSDRAARTTIATPVSLSALRIANPDRRV